MSMFKLKQPSSARVIDFSDSYNDAFIHTDDDDKVISAHKLMLSMQAPYLHRMFQKRKSSNPAEIFLLNMPIDVVENAINLIYGKHVNISKKHIGRFNGLLKKWGVEYEEVSCDSHESLSEATEPDMKEPGSESVEAPRESEESLNTTFRKDTFEYGDNMDVTKTDSIEIDKNLQYISHQSDKTEASFSCLFCHKVSLHFQQAKTHFVLFHQENEAEIKIFQEAEVLRKSSQFYFVNLSSKIENGKLENETEALMNSSKKVQDLNSMLEKVECINKPVFPPTLERKQRALIISLGESIKLGENCMEKIETMTT